MLYEEDGLDEDPWRPAQRKESSIGGRYRNNGDFNRSRSRPPPNKYYGDYAYDSKYDKSSSSSYTRRRGRTIDRDEYYNGAGRSRSIEDDYRRDRNERRDRFPSRNENKITLNRTNSPVPRLTGRKASADELKSYRLAIREMRDMGFADSDICVEALLYAGGNVNSAVNIIVAQPNKSISSNTQTSKNEPKPLLPPRPSNENDANMKKDFNNISNDLADATNNRTPVPISAVFTGLPNDDLISKSSANPTYSNTYSTQSFPLSQQQTFSANIPTSNPTASYLQNNISTQPTGLPPLPSYGNASFPSQLQQQPMYTNTTGMYGNNIPQVNSTLPLNTTTGQNPIQMQPTGIYSQQSQLNLQPNLQTPLQTSLQTPYQQSQLQQTPLQTPLQTSYQQPQLQQTSLQTPLATGYGFPQQQQPQPTRLDNNTIVSLYQYPTAYSTPVVQQGSIPPPSFPATTARAPAEPISQNTTPGSNNPFSLKKKEYSANPLDHTVPERLSPEMANLSAWTGR